MANRDQGITREGRGEEQPKDKARAQTVHKTGNVKYEPSDEERQRIQGKQGGHHLPPHATENPMDDTDRNTDKVIKPSQRKPEPYVEP